MDFIEILIKSIKTTIPGVKIPKLGREIIEILQGIYRNFDIFPQKCVSKQVFTSIWGIIGENFANTYQVYVSLYNSVGVCNTSG